jgi:hypothetical protein
MSGMERTFMAREMFVLAWPLLVDTLCTILTLGNWSPRLYSKAFHSNWLARWFAANRGAA